MTSVFLYLVGDVAAFPMSFKDEEKQLFLLSFRKHKCSFGYNLINPIY